MRFFLLAIALAAYGVGCGGGTEETSADTTTDTGTVADTGSTDTGTDTDTNDTGTDTDSGTDTDTDTGTDSGGDDVTEPEVPEIADLSGLTLTGVEPSENLEAPEFEVLASDGTTRTQDNLIGQPTIIWFFPVAESWSVG